MGWTGAIRALRTVPLISGHTLLGILPKDQSPRCTSTERTWTGSQCALLPFIGHVFPCSRSSALLGRNSSVPTNASKARIARRLGHIHWYGRGR